MTSIERELRDKWTCNEFHLKTSHVAIISEDPWRDRVSMSMNEGEERDGTASDSFIINPKKLITNLQRCLTSLLLHPSHIYSLTLIKQCICGNFRYSNSLHASQACCSFILVKFTDEIYTQDVLEQKNKSAVLSMTSRERMEEGQKISAGEPKIREH